MEDLLERLRRQAWTLTVYNHEGLTDRLDAIRRSLTAQGVAVRTVADADGPRGVCLFHRGDELVEATTLEELALDIGEQTAGDPIERAFAGADPFAAVETPFDGSPVVTGAPTADRGTMVGLSREFERQALRRGSGTIRAGFQRLSRLADSRRTRSIYERLADAGVDVTVHGTPDATLDASFEVVADEDETLADYWFVLYDGGPEYNGALVAHETEPSTYEAFWTTDLALTAELFDLAAQCL